MFPLFVWLEPGMAILASAYLLATLVLVAFEANSGCTLPGPPQMRVHLMFSLWLFYMLCPNAMYVVAVDLLVVLFYLSLKVSEKMCNCTYLFVEYYSHWLLICPIH